MSPVFLFTDYFLWHYTRAFAGILTLWTNLMWFLIHFFSIPVLLKTLFSPLKRVKEEYKGGNVEDYLGAFVVNVMTRVIGALIRIPIILIGLISMFVLCIGLFLFLTFWLVAPAALVFLFILGLAMILV